MFLVIEQNLPFDGEENFRVLGLKKPPWTAGGKFSLLVLKKPPCREEKFLSFGVEKTTSLYGGKKNFLSLSILFHT